MPKRSTPFQQLVLHLQRVLSPGCTVEESAMLFHRLTETEREVDVVIRKLVGEHTVVISVECIDHARPADVTWVEEMTAKHEWLPTDRLVLVSRSGFYAPALVLAATKGAHTYTPETAVEAPWTEIVGKESQMWIAGYDFTPRSAVILVGDLWKDAGFETMIKDSSGQDMTLKDVVMYAVRSHETFGRGAMDAVTRDGASQLTFEFAMTPPPVAFDMLGQAHVFTKVKVQIDVVRRTDRMDVSSLAWHGLPAAIAVGQTRVGEARLTLIEKSAGELDATLRLDGKDLAVHRPGAKQPEANGAPPTPPLDQPKH